MKKISIFKDDELKFSAVFSTLEEVNEYVAREELNGTFSITSENPTHIYTVEDYVDQEAINAEAQAYLDATDKWFIRFIETGREMPDGMSEQRELARSRIVHST